MLVDVETYLKEAALKNGILDDIMLPKATLETENIHILMINEVPPKNPEDWFYSNSECPDYMKTALALFQNAGVQVCSMDEILNLGIYITTAVKAPKSEYTVSEDMIKSHLPLLEEEINLFPNLKVIMLMGDVAKKCVNRIAKAKTKKNLIPSGATYKIRGNELYWDHIRVFPSYIMTGGNILIEKSKCTMISDDIARMMKFIEA